jgi:hypothetical protein
MPVTPDNITAGLRAIQRQGIAQIPDEAHHWMTRGYDPPPEAEAAADEAIRLARDQLRPGKERPAAGVEVTIIRVRDCGL